ncbi:MAG: hypothetical protein K2H74_06510 [Paramuribaculum sp.]|nr:hypothetical protein [Paramuribaculum sp.]MDE6382982.1 hypothetical protein [Paramuribaculum sp.]MDE6783063.1 hypothetical protein [Paramuribaculum sp.]
MNTATKFRLFCITLLWLLLCWIVVASTPRITLYTIFILVASGIVVFVPLYKKYKKQ